MKKNKTAVVATEEKAIETIVAEAPVVETPIVVAETKAAEEAKRAPGRPIVEGSARQQRMAAREAALKAGLLKRGRPSIDGSKRQLKLQARAAKIAAGIELKPGRPKMEKKPETSNTPAVVTEG